MKSFLKHFLFYMVPEVMTAMMPLLILPITTKYFGLREFGTIALFGLCQLPFVLLREFGVGYVMPGKWFDLDAQQRKVFLFMLLSISACITMTSIVLITPVYKWIFQVLSNDSAELIISLYPWMVLLVLFQFVTPIYLNWVVLTKKSHLFITLKSISLISTTIVTVSLIVITENVKWVIIGTCLVGIILDMLRLAVLWPHVTLKWQPSFFKETLTIGYPIFFRSLFNQVRKQIDKIFVSALYSTEVFALYNWSLQFYWMFSIFESQFSKVYTPDLYQSLSAGQTDLSKFRRMFFAWYFLVFLGCMVFYFVGELLINWVSNGVYVQAYSIILILAIVGLIDSSFIAVSISIIQKKKTKIILYITVITSLICFIVTYLLVPKFATYGGVFSLISLALFTGLLGSIVNFRLMGQAWIELKGCIYTMLYIIGLLFHFFYDGIFLARITMLFACICITIHLLIQERRVIGQIYKKIRGELLGVSTSYF